MIPELPNTLFSNGRSVLSKFGYVHFEDGQGRDDWAEDVGTFKGGFPVTTGNCSQF